MDIIYIITDSESKLKYLGSKKNWKGKGTYFGSPSCKNKNNKKYKLQQEWKINVKNRPETFKFKILEKFDNLKHSELIKKEFEYQVKLNVVKSKVFINAGFAKQGFHGDTMSNLTEIEKQIRKNKISNSLIKTFSKMSKNEKKLKFSKIGESNPNWKGGISTKICICGKKIKGKFKKQCKDCYFKNRNISGFRNPFFGKTHSVITKKILSEKRKGNTPGNMKLISINGIIYKGLNDASQNLNIKNTTIWYRIKSSNQKYQDYKYV